MFPSFPPLQRFGCVREIAVTAVPTPRLVDVHRVLSVVTIDTIVSLVILGVMGPPKASAESEVSQFDVSVGVDQNVIRFYVSVNETHFVYAFDRQHQFCDIKPVEQKQNKNI